MAAMARIIISVFFLFFSLAYVVSSWGLPYKATVLPYIVIFCIVLIGGTLLARDILRLVGSMTEARKRAQAARAPVSDNAHAAFPLLRPAVLRPVLTLVLLCAYIYVTQWVDFYVASFLFLMAECFVIGVTRKQLPAVIVTMLAFTGFAYLFFELLLQIPL